MNKLLLILCAFIFFIACSKNKYQFDPSSSCDLSDGNITYKGSIINNDTITGIRTILELNCNYSPCHSHPPMDSSLTFDFTTYDGVKRVVGSIKNRINRPVDDPLHMPKGLPGDTIGRKMSACDLAKMNAWIINGAPDN